MGGRSKSKSSSSSNNTVNTGALTQQGATQQAQQMGGAAQHQQNLQNSQLSHVMPAFGEMVRGAMGSFADNPMASFMGAALGMPIQMQTPGFMEDFINKYKPQEPAPQEPQPYNVNDDMRARMGMGTPYGIDPAPYAHMSPNLRALEKGRELYNPGMPLYTDSPLVGDLSGVRR